MQDTFYNVRTLTVIEKKAICDDAHKVATEWWTDMLDCKISWFRTRVDMDYDEIMSKLTNGCHFVVIHRRQDDPDNRGRWPHHKDYGEIGFSTMTCGPDYYLWIHTTVDDLNRIVKKFNLRTTS